MKRNHAVACIGLGLAFLCGCERHSNKETFYLVTANAGLPYWQTAAAGFNHAAQQYKVTGKVVGPEGYDPQAELAALQQAVASKPAGILISVADAAVLLPGINAAVQAGVPVITIDSDAANSHRLFFIGTNNDEAGGLAGRHVLEKLKGKGNVIVFTLTGQPNTEERLKGFKDAIEGKQISIAEVIDVKGDPRAAVAFDRAQVLLNQSGPKKIDAFVCFDSASGKMVSDAIKRANATDRLLVAFDVNQDTLDGIKGGSIEATIAQKPYTMGYFGLKSLDEVFHNPPQHADKDFAADSFSPYPVFVDTGTSLVDKNNVDFYLASATAQK
ncbi:sugar ABC transporter substrate-binding protein [Acidobacteria bacterium AB60]|nr:sugar ABC transporter substrate-binding protein [Acidobacteria bacterium AB60]